MEFRMKGQSICVYQGCSILEEYLVIRTPPDSATTAITTDDLFKTLSNRRRRYVLHYLKQHADAEAVPIRTLSEQIAAWENGVEAAAVSSKQRKRIYTALHQTHLPRMDRLGIIKYDANRGTVTMADSLEQFDIYFELTRADDVPWSHVYLGVGAVASALMLGVWLSLWPFTTVSPAVYASVFAALFVVLGGYHTIQERRGYLGAGSPPELLIPGDGATTVDVQPTATGSVAAARDEPNTIQPKR